MSTEQLIYAILAMAVVMFICRVVPLFVFKNKIKNFFNRSTKEDYISLGKELLEKELRKRKISMSDFTSEENLDRISKQFKLDSMEDIYLNIGNNKYTAKTIVKVEDKESKETKVDEKQKQKSEVIKQPAKDIVIDEDEDDDFFDDFFDN